MKLRLIIKIVLCLIVPLLAFWLGDFNGWTRLATLIEKHGIYVYDTQQQQKFEELFKKSERQVAKEMGLPPNSPEVKEFMTKILEHGRPLVAVGPFVVFVNNDGNIFSVHETQSVKQERGLLFPLVELDSREQSKHLGFTSSAEKGGKLPRFSSRLTYSEDGIYENGIIFIHREDRTLERAYFDSEGNGAFDVMLVFEPLYQNLWVNIGSGSLPRA